MANLHVQPKRKNYAWLWIIILVLIIAAAVYYFLVYKKQVPAADNALLHNSSLQFQAALQTPANASVILF